MNPRRLRLIQQFAIPKRVDPMRSFSWRMLPILLALAIAPLTVFAQPAPAPATSLDSASHTLRISVGDLLELNVFDTPELSGKLRVNESGEVMLPVAGATKVSGMTAEEASVAIEEKFRGTDVLKYPHVSIFIAEYATQGVTVTGEVKNPGIYPMLGNHSLLDLVSAAGGVNPAAGKAITVTHKSEPSKPEVVQLDYKPGSIASSIDIRPGDTIQVSRAGIVYVVGDVSKPGGFLMQGNDPLTVLNVIALAQGTNHTAAANKAKLIRKTSNGREEYNLELKRILANKLPDVPVEDGDILYVPTSGLKAFEGRTADMAVALTTGVIIYGHLY